MTPDTKTDFMLGQLTGQVAALVTTVNNMSITITNLDARLQKNEKDTNILTFKIAMIGIVAGGVGSIIMTVLYKIFL